MYNWSVRIKRLRKDKEKYTVWKLEQLINFGLKNEKLNPDEVKTYFHKLTIDPDKRIFLDLLLYGKKPAFK